MDEALVLGIGNVLWADEGFGVRCVEAFDEAGLGRPGAGGPGVAGEQRAGQGGARYGNGAVDGRAVNI